MERHRRPLAYNPGTYAEVAMKIDPDEIRRPMPPAAETKKDWSPWLTWQIALGVFMGMTMHSCASAIF